MLVSFIRFHITISHLTSSSYLLSAANSFSSRSHLFLFHCAGSSLLNFCRPGSAIYLTIASSFRVTWDHTPCLLFISYFRYLYWCCLLYCNFCHWCCGFRHFRLCRRCYRRLRFLCFRRLLYCPLWWIVHQPSFWGWRALAFVGSAHLCEHKGMLVFFMTAVTYIVITSFTLFPHSIAALALLKPFLPDFVLPVSRHTLSILYFFFLKNIIALV